LAVRVTPFAVIEFSTEVAMEIQIHGKQIDVGDALRAHVRERLTHGVAKYFDGSIHAQVTFSRDGPLFRSDSSVHLASGISLQAQAKGNDIYACFDQAADRLEKQLRRYKRRLRDHHNNNKDAVPALTVPSYVIAAEIEEEEEPAGLDPVIVAEMTTELKTLTVGEAVMHLDLSNVPVLVFRNSANSILNVVYRRDDGNIGWVDPHNESVKQS
jgi:ribosomal subunit interface protein